MRKALSLLLCMLLLFSQLNSVIVYAESADSPEIVISSESAEAGSTAEVVVSIHNNTGLLGGKFRLNYDNGISLISVEAGTAFEALTLTKPGELIDGCNFVWDATDIDEKNISDGVILTLKFMIPEDAEVGQEYQVGFTCVDAVDGSLNPITILGGIGKISVAKSSKAILNRITAQKTKTEYSVGEMIDADDIVVRAFYSDESSKVVTGYRSNASSIDTSSAGKRKLIVSYSESGVEQQTEVEIEIIGSEPVGVSKIKIDNSEVFPGERVTVNVLISDNPGVLGMSLKLEYDVMLTLINAESGSAFSTLTMTRPGVFMSGAKFVWDGTDIEANDIKDGVILSLTFDVSDDAMIGDDLVVTAVCEDPIDFNLKPVRIILQSGTLSVVNKPEKHIHTIVVDEAVPATCVKTGLTEGRHCSACGEVIKKQEETPVVDHVWGGGKIVKAVTCTTSGEKTFSCKICGKTKTEAIKAPGHKVVKDKAVAATYNKQGKTEGSHCSICGTVLVKQKAIAKLVKNGLFKEGRKTYFYVNSVKQKGWKTIKNKKYYFDPKTKAMVIGWKKIGKKKYFFSPKAKILGQMQTGWQTVDKGKYYLDKKGVMQTGWLTIGKKKYYLDKSTGAMKTEWLNLKGKWYFFTKKGVMVTGTKKIEGKKYKFNKKGICLNP